MPTNIIAMQSLYCKRRCSPCPITLLTQMDTIPNLYIYQRKNSGREIASKIIISLDTHTHFGLTRNIPIDNSIIIVGIIRTVIQTHDTHSY